VVSIVMSQLVWALACGNQI
jgi:hypothetical protein